MTPGVKSDPEFGNVPVEADAQLLLELNMSTTPRTLHLYINNVLQPKFITGFPESVRFIVGLYFPDVVVQFKTLRKIASQYMH